MASRRPALSPKESAIQSAPASAKSSSLLSSVTGHIKNATRALFGEEKGRSSRRPPRTTRIESLEALMMMDGNGLSQLDYQDPLYAEVAQERPGQDGLDAMITELAHAHALITSNQQIPVPEKIAQAEVFQLDLLDAEENVRSSLPALDGALTQIGGHISGLQSSLQTIEERLHSLEEERPELSGKIESARTLINKLRAEIPALEKNILTEEKGLLPLRKKAEDTAKALEKAERKHDGAIAGLAKADANVRSDLKSKGIEVTPVIKRSASHDPVFFDALDTMAAITKNRNKLSTAEATRGMTKLNIAGTLYAATRTPYLNAERTNAQVQDAFASANAKTIAAKDELILKKETIEVKENELHVLEARSDEIESEYEMLSITKTGMKGSILSLEGQGTSLTNAKAELEALLHNMSVKRAEVAQLLEELRAELAAVDMVHEDLFGEGLIELGEEVDAFFADFDPALLDLQSENAVANSAMIRDVSEELLRRAQQAHSIIVGGLVLESEAITFEQKEELRALLARMQGVLTTMESQIAAYIDSVKVLASQNGVMLETGPGPQDEIIRTVETTIARSEDVPHSVDDIRTETRLDLPGLGSATVASWRGGLTVNESTSANALARIDDEEVLGLRGTGKALTLDFAGTQGLVSNVAFTVRTGRPDLSVEVSFFHGNQLLHSLSAADGETVEYQNAEKGITSVIVKNHVNLVTGGVAREFLNYWNGPNGQWFYQQDIGWGEHTTNYGFGNRGAGQFFAYYPHYAHFNAEQRAELFRTARSHGEITPVTIEDVAVDALMHRSQKENEPLGLLNNNHLAIATAPDWMEGENPMNDIVKFQRSAGGSGILLPSQSGRASQGTAQLTTNLEGNVYTLHTITSNTGMALGRPYYVRNGNVVELPAEYYHRFDDYRIAVLPGGPRYVIFPMSKGGNYYFTQTGKTDLDEFNIPNGISPEFDMYIIPTNKRPLTDLFNGIPSEHAGIAPGAGFRGQIFVTNKGTAADTLTMRAYLGYTGSDRDSFIGEQSITVAPMQSSHVLFNGNIPGTSTRQNPMLTIIATDTHGNTFEYGRTLNRSDLKGSERGPADYTEAEQDRLARIGRQVEMAIALGGDNRIASWYPAGTTIIVADQGSNVNEVLPTLTLELLQEISRLSEEEIKELTKEYFNTGVNLSKMVADIKYLAANPALADVTVSGVSYGPQPLEKYVVRSGDTLSGIAQRYGISDYMALYNHPLNKAFKSLRPNPNQIDVGDVLFIPKELMNGNGQQGGTTEFQWVSNPYDLIPSNKTSHWANLPVQQAKMEVNQFVSQASANFSSPSLPQAPASSSSDILEMNDDEKPLYKEIYGQVADLLTLIHKGFSDVIAEYDYRIAGLYQKLVSEGSRLNLADKAAIYAEITANGILKTAVAGVKLATPETPLGLGIEIATTAIGGPLLKYVPGVVRAAVTKVDNIVGTRLISQFENLINGLAKNIDDLTLGIGYRNKATQKIVDLSRGVAGDYMTIFDAGHPTLHIGKTKEFLIARTSNDELFEYTVGKASSFNDADTAVRAYEEIINDNLDAFREFLANPDLKRLELGKEFEGVMGKIYDPNVSSDLIEGKTVRLLLKRADNGIVKLQTIFVD